MIPNRLTPSQLVVAVAGILFGLFSVISSAQAQTAPDIQPPVIEIEALAESRADQNQVFTAQIAEDQVLKDATLYYRRAGQQPFTAAAMKPLGDTGYFSVSIETDAADLRAIEYYVQARDEGGNRTVSGFAFDPFTRTLLPAADPVASQAASAGTASESSDTPVLTSSSGTQRRWVAIALGVLAVGVLSSLSGGSSSNVDTAGTVPLTINLREP